MSTASTRVSKTLSPSSNLGVPVKNVAEDESFIAVNDVVGGSNPSTSILWECSSAVEHEKALF